MFTSFYSYFESHKWRTLFTFYDNVHCVKFCVMVCYADIQNAIYRVGTRQVTVERYSSFCTLYSCVVPTTTRCEIHAALAPLLAIT